MHHSHADEHTRRRPDADAGEPTSDAGDADTHAAHLLDGDAHVDPQARQDAAADRDADAACANANDTGRFGNGYPARPAARHG